ncbi:MAG: cupin domain-containing protein [Acidimicrobiales bacterium]
MGPEPGVSRFELHHVAKVDWSLAEAPPELAGHAPGLTRRQLIDRQTGAVHTDLSVSLLDAGGLVGTHVHASEEAVYVLAGDPVLSLDGRHHLLRPGDYALVPVGMAHGWGNPTGAEARWLTVATPQRLGVGDGRRHTVVLAETPGERAGAAPSRPDLADPTARYVGHYEGTPPQVEALSVDEALRGRAPAGMDTALLAYSGISVKMMVDRVLGAELLTMFMVDYEIGGAAQAHDHPFEEAYFFLEGMIEAELDGKPYRLGAGDVVFAGVGSTHAFYNTGPGRVRWIETQAPRPPERHAYRWVEPWRRLEEGYRSAQRGGDRVEGGSDR